MNPPCLQFRLAKLLLTLILCSAITLPPSTQAQSTQSTGSRPVKTRVNPAYPELAKRSGISGVVKIEIVISAAGNVKSTKVLGGHPLLVGPAEEAVKQWKYESGSGESTTVVEFRFAPNA